MIIKRTGVRILAVLAIILVAGVVLFQLPSSGPPSIDTNAARAIAERFLTHIHDGKPDDAWNDTSTEFKSLQGRDTFRATAKTKPLKQSAVFVSCEPDTANGLSLMVCQFQLGSNRARVSLAPEGDAWKVERLVVE